MEAARGDILLVLGRQPALGLAELESLYGAVNVCTVGTFAALVKNEVVDFNRLGGSVKACKVLSVRDTGNWNEVITSLRDTAPDLAAKTPTGKIKLGISALGFNVSPAKINAGGLTIKKAIVKSGRSVRLVPNKTSLLSSAQVIHNHLTGANGLELVIIKNGGKTIIAETEHEQDIASYALRDRGRPKRDARVGMLPPKLAQIIINLATGQITDDRRSTADDGSAKISVLDPFCGTGVILQEASLMNYKTYGADLEQRMVDYSNQNLAWLETKFRPPHPNSQIELGDATSYAWQQPIDLVASEAYLGRPFTSPPTPETLAKTVSECNTIIKKFLRNIHGQLQSGTRLCLAVPAWRIDNGSKPTAHRPSPIAQFKHLPLIDQISDLGYNRISFEHVRDANLIYFRENQIVARQLLVITRK